MSHPSEVKYQPFTPDLLQLTQEDFRQLGLEIGQGLVLPVLHGRMEFAWMVRRVIERYKPSAIAIELPETLTQAVLRAVSRLPLLSVIRYPNLSEHGKPMYLPIEPADALVEAVRRGLELKIPVHLIDRDNPYPRSQDKIPDSLAAEYVGARGYLETALQAVAHGQRHPEDELREDTMAFHFHQLLAQAKPKDRILFVCGMYHAHEVIRKTAARMQQGELQTTPIRRLHRSDTLVFHLAEESSREILAEPAFINAAYERARSTVRTIHPQKTPLPSATVVHLFAHRSQENAYEEPANDSLPVIHPGRMGLWLELCKAARKRYQEQYASNLRPGQLHGLLRYACRYAYTEDALGPDLYQLLIAARGFVDDNYAYDVWQVATTYPWQTQSPDLSPIELTLRDLHPHVRSIRFRPRTLQQRRKLLRILKPRPHEKRKGEWAEKFTGNTICSFPPEDIAIEQYGTFLRKRSLRELSASHTQTIPFMSSLYDGIDVRETIRNWHEDTFYVRIQQAVRNQAGAVVVIFDDEPVDASKYPWLMTWQGEHDEESDMALYATNPFERIVGPGIGRSFYGGFLLNRPPHLMYGVWEDPDFQLAQSKAEVLLWAGLVHSQDRLVIYVSASPPRAALRQVAWQLDKKLIYVPLGQLSPVALKKLRIFHVLSDQQIRTVAHQYIKL